MSRGGYSSAYTAFRSLDVRRRPGEVYKRSFISAFGGTIEPKVVKLTKT